MHVETHGKRCWSVAGTQFKPHSAPAMRVARRRASHFQARLDQRLALLLRQLHGSLGVPDDSSCAIAIMHVHTDCAHAQCKYVRIHML